MSIAARRHHRAVDKLRRARGAFYWLNPSAQSQAALQATLSDNWIAGLSVFCRMDDLLPTSATAYDWSFFDKAFAAAVTVNKPVLLMVIHGGIGSGLPAWYTAGLPSDEMITADGATFACFWSPTANARAEAMRQAIADRYGDHPLLYSMRITTDWSTHGEPWFKGGAAGEIAWGDAWDAFRLRTGTPGLAGFVGAKQHYYDVHIPDLIASYAAKFPRHVSLTIAAGDGLDDIVGAYPSTDVRRHPAQLQNCKDARALYGNRFVMQFNGVNATTGASGYGQYLPIAFGPAADINAVTEPQRGSQGRIGSQPVGGVTSGAVPMTAAEFTTMIGNLTTDGYSYFECYGTDVRAAETGATSDGLAIRAALQSARDNWAW